MSSKSPFMSRRYKGLLAHQLIRIWNHHELGKGHTGITLQEVKCVHTYVRARKREPAGSVKMDYFNCSYNVLNLQEVLRNCF